MQQVTLPPPSPRSVVPDVPAELEAVILKALEKQPEARYQTSDALASALMETDADPIPSYDFEPAPPPSAIITPDDKMSWSEDEKRRQRIAEGVATLDDLEQAEVEAFAPAKPDPDAVTDVLVYEPAPVSEEDDQDEGAEEFDEMPAAEVPEAPAAEPVQEAEPLPPGEAPDWLADEPVAAGPAAPPLPVETPDLEVVTAAPEPAPSAMVPSPPAPAQPMPASPRPVTAGSGQAADSTPVQFSAYYPREVQPEVWQPLHAYIYRQSASRAVTEDIHHQLGSLLPAFRAVGESSRREIPRGELITATPNLPGFRFNPPSLSIAFYESWHRFDFKLQAFNAPLNQAANGWLTFTLAGVIVADIPLSIFVGEKVTSDHLASDTARLYQAIFCSYSHEDTRIVERVERAYKALGLEYLRDVVSLKSGTHWSEELLEMIDKADIFQLFWSPAAAESNFVRQEWEYALNLKREQANFIRPVYWQQPMPPAPEPMNHIHFAYQPDLDA
jgi:hypothetical protein